MWHSLVESGSGVEIRDPLGRILSALSSASHIYSKTLVTEKWETR